MTYINTVYSSYIYINIYVYIYILYMYIYIYIYILYICIYIHIIYIYIYIYIYYIYMYIYYESCTAVCILYNAKFLCLHKLRTDWPALTIPKVNSQLSIWQSM